MEIEVKIRALMMDPNSGTPIIILKDVQSDTMLPIWVGAYEANAIALEIEKIAPPRPMTHDLLRNLIVQLGSPGGKSGGDEFARQHVFCRDRNAKQ